VTLADRKALGEALRGFGWRNNPLERCGEFAQGTWEKLCGMQRLRVVLLARTGVLLSLEVPFLGGGMIVALLGRSVGPAWAADTAARLDEAACTYFATCHKPGVPDA
jgi:hypothetical protein